MVSRPYTSLGHPFLCPVPSWGWGDGASRLSASFMAIFRPLLPHLFLIPLLLHCTFQLLYIFPHSPNLSPLYSLKLCFSPFNSCQHWDQWGICSMACLTSLTIPGLPICYYGQVILGMGRGQTLPTHLTAFSQQTHVEAPFSGLHSEDDHVNACSSSR